MTVWCFTTQSLIISCHLHIIEGELILSVEATLASLLKMALLFYKVISFIHCYTPGKLCLGEVGYTVFTLSVCNVSGSVTFWFLRGCNLLKKIF